MNNALIGYSGFVGSTLLKQARFDGLFRSTNIAEIEDQQFDMVVCAGAPAMKWMANREPEADLATIERLIAHLKTIRCNTFVLVSTVDVFKSPLGVDESSGVDEIGLHPYGLHRRMLEKFVETHFPKHLIVRLPGLVGPGLRKNVIFDFLNNNNTGAIDSRASFQFYPMVNLWSDIQTSLAARLQLVHLTASPVTVADVATLGFNLPFSNHLDAMPARYDFRTRHASLFGGQQGYQYCARETVQAIRCYAQSEPLANKSVGAAA